MKIRVIDSPCGTGKTEYAIKYMNDNSESSRFIYVTPYLNEIKRVRESVNFDMLEPKDGSKTKDFFDLIFKGKHIATTHALFGKGNNDLVNAIKDNGYELILDEVMTVLQPINFKKGDFNNLIKDKVFDVGDDNVVFLTEYGEKLLVEGTDFEDRLELIKTGRVIMTDANMMLWEFPFDLLNCFQSITIMSYMFDNQTMCNYLLANNSVLDYYRIENYSLVNGGCSYDGRCYKKLINVYEGKLNNVGLDEFSLSSSWFDKQSNRVSKSILANNTYNYLRNIVKKKGNEVIWTVQKKNEKDPFFKIRDYSLSFLEMTARATNLYAERDTCAYLVNRYENPVIQNYFVKHGLNVNNDVFALSELIQWLFRSAIRKNKPINLYIPSKRMRTLLMNWLNGTFESKVIKGEQNGK